MQNTVVIAEAGVNYNGDIEIAKKMVSVAAEAGANIVKFQTGIPEKVISMFAEKADYQKENTKDLSGEESQLDMARKLMLPWNTYEDLIECCKKNNIEFLSTPFDIDSASFLHEMGMKKWKIPSGEITNLPLLEHISSYGEPIILSTGMSTLEDVESAIAIIKNGGCSDITLLQCNTEYPTPYNDVNLKAMVFLKQYFGLPVGFSDHTMGIEASIAATALGASIIEKHFTLDRGMPGPDQVCSIEPHELCELVRCVHNVEMSLGHEKKEPSMSELKNINIARKSIVAAKDIKAGEVLTKENITCKRPGNGISPMKWYDVIGMLASKDYKVDEQIEW